MMLFLSEFVSYLIIVLASMGIIVLAVFCGKKWRDAKDLKDQNELELEKQSEEV